MLLWKCDDAMSLPRPLAVAIESISLNKSEEVATPQLLALLESNPR